MLSTLGTAPFACCLSGAPAHWALCPRYANRPGVRAGGHRGQGLAPDPRETTPLLSTCCWAVSRARLGGRRRFMTTRASDSPPWVSRLLPPTFSRPLNALSRPSVWLCRRKGNRPRSYPVLSQVPSDRPPLGVFACECDCATRGGERQGVWSWMPGCPGGALDFRKMSHRWPPESLHPPSHAPRGMLSVWGADGWLRAGGGTVYPP